MKRDHAGNIEGNTAAGRVLRYLREKTGRQVSNWQIGTDCRVLAVSTRISEIRRQLDPEVESITTIPKYEGRDTKFFYRHDYENQEAAPLRITPAPAPTDTPRVPSAASVAVHVGQAFAEAEASIMPALAMGGDVAAAISAALRKHILRPPALPAGVEHIGGAQYRLGGCNCAEAVLLDTVLNPSIRPDADRDVVLAFVAFRMAGLIS